MPLNSSAYIKIIIIFAGNLAIKTAFAANTIKKDTSAHIAHAAIDVKTSNDTAQCTYIATGNTTPDELLAFACSLECTPYKYGSIDPQIGFDCSGFITYVFNHFNIAVPRSSVDFTFVERYVDINDAKPGDLILFTGSDSTVKVVGHMGIIPYKKDDELIFIHSSSGKSMGVTETPLNWYYKRRFMKIIRVFL